MQASPIVICLSSAGRRVELLRSLRADATALGRNARIIALDMAPGLSAACADADIAAKVPRCSDATYVASVAALCAEHKARLLIPTIDTELGIFSTQRQVLQKAGVHTVVSEPDAVEVARDKLRTAEVLSAAGIPVPRTAPLVDALSNRRQLTFPVVLKRVDGSRSIGLHFVDSLKAAALLDLDAVRYVAQERCVGPEYTVNCYVDQRGSLRAIVPHRRIEVRDGEVSKGVTERRADLAAIAHGIVAAIPGLRGPFCFQAILTDDGPKVFEINARFGGGYPLAHAAGATFGKWLMEETLGLPCTANDQWQDGLLMLRYDAAFYAKR